MLCCTCERRSLSCITVSFVGQEADLDNSSNKTLCMLSPFLAQDCLCWLKATRQLPRIVQPGTRCCSRAHGNLILVRIARRCGSRVPVLTL